MKRYKITALILSLLPIGVLTLFLVGESVENIPGSLGHLVQLLPLVISVAFAWQKPYLGGVVLAGISVILATVFAVTIDLSFEWQYLIVELLIFLPATLSGFFFVLSAKKSSQNK